MRILVLGGSGMAGHVISVYFKEKGYDITVFSRKKVDYCDCIEGDILDFNNLKALIQHENFNVVINAVGILNQQAEENKAKAILLNSYLPHFLEEITKDTSTRIIHMSTDCVFSGNDGSYKENSFKDGPTFYDRSKALGELDNNKDLTFRNSIIGPDRKVEGIGLFNWFMKQDKPINGYTKAYWTGVSTITLARAIETAIKENLTGLYHLVNENVINKYDLLCLFNRYMKNDGLDIEKTDVISIDKSLINTRDDFNFIVPSYEEMIIEIKEWIENHPWLYPHYLN